MSTEVEKSYRQVAGLEVHEADDGLIVFNSDTDRVHHLNPTAGVVFELCSQPRLPAGLIEDLQLLYQDADLPVDEIRRTLAQLVTEGLLEEAQTA